MSSVRLLPILVATLLAAAPLRYAQANGMLTASVPADGAVIDRAPGEAALTFSAEVTIVALTLNGPGHVARPLTLSGAAVDEFPIRKAQRHVTVLLPALSAGSYRLDWRATERNAHPLSGSITFTVSPGATPKP